MANDRRQLSMADLLQSVVHEFSTALQLVKLSHPSVRVRSVKLNLGQRSEDIPATVTAAPLMLADRYPEIDKGWLLKLDLGEGSAAALQGQPLPEAKVILPTALDLFAELPVSVIKGIDTKWSQQLGKKQITKVSHLIAMDTETLEVLMSETRSLLPREFRQKARLLKVVLPEVPTKAFGDQSLYRLLKMPHTELRERTSAVKATRTEHAALIEALETINLVIDSNLLRQVSFAQLLGN